MANEPLQKLTIVGGGSAGWMSACYLDRLFNHHESKCHITVVESADVSSIGVGEATVHSLRFFLASIGVSEFEFLKKTNATFKHGICFKNWRGLGSESDEYFHAFEQPKYNDGISVFAHWANIYGHKSAGKRFDLSVSPQARIALANKSPRCEKHKEYTGYFPYGYHLDAVLFAKFLREVALDRGVKRIEGHVESLGFSADGDISTLYLKDHSTVEGDLFIDCTGFASILMNGLGNTEYIDFSDNLLCDRAVATQVTPDSVREGTSHSRHRPFTTSTAQRSGWIWDIDLFQRSGVGYVYSSAFCSEDEAVETLAGYLDKDSSDLKVNSLKMRVGRRKKFWYKNCVAVGLSAAFIEPLESTGLYFIDMGLRFLGEYIASRKTPEAIIAQYNDMLGQLIDQTRDFIVLHYVLSNREDTDFWRTYKYEIKKSDRLAHNLQLWRTKVPSPSDFAAGGITLFSSANYAFVLYGMGFRHDGVPSSSLYASLERSQQNLESIRLETDRIIDSVPDHSLYLNQIRGFNPLFNL